MHTTAHMCLKAMKHSLKCAFQFYLYLLNRNKPVDIFDNLNKNTHSVLTHTS